MAILLIYVIHSRILMVFIVSEYLTCTWFTHISFSPERVFQLSASCTSARHRLCSAVEGSHATLCTQFLQV